MEGGQMKSYERLHELLMRDADCPCGGVRLTEEDQAALRDAICALRSQPTIEEVQHLRDMLHRDGEEQDRADAILNKVIGIE